METAVSLPGFTALPTMKRPPHSGKKIKNCFHSTTGCGTVLSDTEIDEELDTENEVQIQKLQQALTQLKPDEQALVTLFYEEEKNIEEIAYIFHLTESNVKVKLHRIRKKLCNLMKEEI